MENQREEHLNEASSLEQQTLAATLRALADPALTRLEADDLSGAVLRCLREIMTVDNLAILLLTEDHTALHIHTVLGLEETVAHEVHVPLGYGFAGQIITQGVPLIVHNTSMLEIITPLLREELSSLLGVPLIVHQQVIGVLHVGTKREYLFTDADVALLVDVADYLAQAFERTLLIEAEQHEFEELIEAQLCAVIELVQAQQRVEIELMEAQQHVAGELVQAQQRVAIELVGAQLHTAVELIGAQLHTAVELVGVQLPTADELIEAQQHAADELMETQQRVAIELVGAQLHAAGELIEAQLRVIGEPVGAQEHTASELLEEQQQAAGKLVGAQLPTAGELMEVQQRVAGNLVATQQHAAGELMEAQLQRAIKLVGDQQQVAIELVEAQQQVAIELIEEQQRMRLKALERMNELETIFNAIMDGIVVYDEHEHIVRSNRAAHHLLGIEAHPVEMSNDFSPSWITTYQLRDVYGHPFSTEHLPLKCLLRGEKLASRQAVTVHLHTLDARDVQIGITGAPLYTQEGHLYGAVCVLRDVTTRKHMERRIEILDGLLQMVELLVKSSAQKEQMVTPDDPTLVIQQIESNILALAQRLLGCSHAIIIDIHPGVHILSPLAQVGFSTQQEQRLRSALTGAPLSLLITDPSHAALLEKHESLPFHITQSPLLPYLSPLSSAPNCYLVPIHITHHLIGLLGIVFPDGASLSNSGGVALITAIGKLCALALQYEQQTIERDQVMAARVFLNEQLEQVNKMQSDFISVVSHEFRTALTTIEGFSTLLRDEEYPSNDVKEYANDIYIDALRLHRMVTDLLDVEQMKKGKMQLHMEEVDMNVLLATIVKHMELVSIRHTLRLSLDEKLPHFEGDPDKLTQVITNVLSNAIKYSPMGGDILIISRREGTSVHVSIQDQGTGIASERLETIFTPYNRIASEQTRYIQGTGLGLSLARETIHLHEGTIWVESIVGHGSTFHISLPFVRVNEEIGLKGT
ncbi:MAG: GAF domain-containing protein [Ktedonobacteraceae bacterium]|nr:GAF domain-containing protein [Ktedonobacteraceae bacterium]